MRNCFFNELNDQNIVGVIKYSKKYPFGCVPQKKYDEDMKKIESAMESMLKRSLYFTLMLEEGDEEIELDEYCHLKLVND